MWMERMESVGVKERVSGKPENSKDVVANSKSLKYIVLRSEVFDYQV
jgi:hypothetical protein